MGIKPVNAVDAGSMAHDLAYNRIQDKYKADNDKAEAIKATRQADLDLLHTVQNLPKDQIPSDGSQKAVIAAMSSKMAAEDKGMLNPLKFSVTSAGHYAARASAARRYKAPSKRNRSRSNRSRSRSTSVASASSSHWDRFKKVAKGVGKVGAGLLGAGLTAGAGAGLLVHKSLKHAGVKEGLFWKPKSSGHYRKRSQTPKRGRSATPRKHGKAKAISPFGVAAGMAAAIPLMATLGMGAMAAHSLSHPFGKGKFKGRSRSRSQSKEPVDLTNRILKPPPGDGKRGRSSKRVDLRDNSIHSSAKRRRKRASTPAPPKVLNRGDD
jgi:hypothetical protein